MSGFEGNPKKRNGRKGNGQIFADIDQKGVGAASGARASTKAPEGSLLSNSLCSRLSFLGIGSEVMVGAETQFDDEAAG